METDRVYLGNGAALGYDVLIVATGARLQPEETDGLTGRAGRGTSSPSTPPRAPRRCAGRWTVRPAAAWSSSIVDMPIKCPVAPLEFCFLADDYFRRRGIRDRVELTYVTPLDGAFTKPVASRQLAGLLAAKGIELVTEFSTGTVQAPARRPRKAAWSPTTSARCHSTWP